MEDNEAQKGTAQQSSGPGIKKVGRGASEYTFFNQKLREPQPTSDIYDYEGVASLRRQWEILSAPGERKYLEYVKSLCRAWPSLTLLADFMEIGTSPVRWRSMRINERERAERVSLTNVTQLDYLDSNEVISNSYKTSVELKNALAEQGNELTTFRLFIVEDLSRDVIEHLGARYNIDPHFFRQQIFDYGWYNTSDRWVEPTPLHLATAQRQWFQLRFTSGRYFRTSEEFMRGFSEAAKWNVLRRPDDDLNGGRAWDQVDAKVGLIRSRAAFWLSSSKSETVPVGVLLVDPTLRAGFPLWYGSDNWEIPPGMDGKIPSGPPRTSLYEDLIYWAKKTDQAMTPSQIPTKALLCLVASEWNQIADYILTRLGQIEWEVSFPEHFLGSHSAIETSLKRLYIWRRLIPLYRRMLTETLERVFQVTANGISIANASWTESPGTENRSQEPPKWRPGNTMRDEFALVLSRMEEFQQRVDILTSVVVSISEARRTEQGNKRVARLTVLATFFIPLSFVTGLFSMTDDIGTLHETIKWFFAAALPLALATFAMAILPFTQLMRWLR